MIETSNLGGVALFDTIILGADGSANAQRAGVVARELAGKMGSRVIVVHGFPHVPRTLIGDQE